MGKKGTPHRKFSKEEKMKYVRLHLEEHLSVNQIEQEYGMRLLRLAQHRPKHSSRYPYLPQKAVSRLRLFSVSVVPSVKPWR